MEDGLAVEDFDYLCEDACGLVPVKVLVGCGWRGALDVDCRAVLGVDVCYLPIRVCVGARAEVLYGEVVVGVVRVDWVSNFGLGRYYKILAGRGNGWSYGYADNDRLGYGVVIVESVKISECHIRAIDALYCKEGINCSSRLVSRETVVCPLPWR